MPRSFVKLKYEDLVLMKNFRNNILIPTRRFLVISLIFAFINIQVHAQEPERPSSGAMMIDVPVRILSLGLSVVSTAFFVVALPLSLSSGSTGEAWWKIPLNLHSSGLWVSLMIGKQLLLRKKKTLEKK